MQGKLKNFKTGSQCQKILDYLKQGRRLTVASCLINGWGANLRSRISDLKDAGYNIKSEKITHSCGYFAEYSLIKDK